MKPSHAPNSSESVPFTSERSKTLNKMNKNYLIYGFLVLAFGVIQINGVLAQGFIERFWQNNKKSVLFSGGEYDDTRPFFIGITGGFTYLHYSIENSANWNTIPVEMPTANVFDNFSTITADPGTAYSIGIPIRVRLSQRYSVSSALIWSFERGHMIVDGRPSGRRLKYEYSDNENVQTFYYEREFESTKRSNFNRIEIPLHFKIHSDQKFWRQKSEHPYRIYMLGGIRVIRNLEANSYNEEVSNFDKKAQIPLTFKPSYFMLEAGVGYDLYFPYFKTSIELRYSESSGNILDYAQYNLITDALHKYPKKHFNPYMDAISKLGIRGWQFSIILE